MNKFEQSQVAKAKSYAAMGELSMAANTLAILDRSTYTAKTSREIREVIESLGLTHLLCKIGSCLVLRTEI